MSLVQEKGQAEITIAPVADRALYFKNDTKSVLYENIMYLGYQYKIWELN